MDCSEIKEYLLDSVIGESLPGEVGGKVREHLSGCPPCREESKKLASAWRSLDKLERVSFPGSLSGSALREVKRRERAPVFLLSRRMPARLGVYAWAAAAVLIAAAGTFLTMRFAGLPRKGKRIVADRSASTFNRGHPALPDVAVTLDAYLKQAADVLSGFEDGSYATWREALGGILARDLQGQANYLLEHLPAGSPSHRVVKKLHGSFWSILQAGRGREDEVVRLPEGVEVELLLREIDGFQKNKAR